MEKKKGFLPENSSAGELHEMVQATFPKLYEAGGYEFLHAEPSSRRLKAIAPGPNGYTMEYLKQFVGQGRIYIRPIQSNLDIDDVVIPAKMSVPDEFCQQCYKFFPMNELRQHLDVCVPFDAQPGVSGDQDNIPGKNVVEEPPREQIDQGDKQVISEESEVSIVIL